MQQIIEKKKEGVSPNECNLTREERDRNAKNWRVLFLAVISTGIKDFLDFKNRRTLMSDTQIAQTAEMLLDEYPQLTVSDVSLFFRMCKMGKFGEMVDLDGTTILRWCERYIKDRHIALNSYYEMLEKCKKAESEEQPADPAYVDSVLKRMQESIGRVANHMNVNTPKQETIEQRINKIKLQVIRDNHIALMKDMATYEEKLNALIKEAIENAGLKE